MINRGNSNTARKKRHLRIRNRIQGTAERPRLSIFRSGKHMYAQLVDDLNGHTLVSASTVDPDLKNLTNGANVEAASKVGELIAKRAKEQGYEKVIFDRSGYLYHGRVEALADAARKAGLSF